MRKLAKANEWTDAEYLLWRVEYLLRSFIWAHTEDAKYERNCPQPLPNPAIQSKYESLSASARFDEIADALGIELEGGVADGC